MRPSIPVFGQPCLSAAGGRSSVVCRRGQSAASTDAGRTVHWNPDGNVTGPSASARDFGYGLTGRRLLTVVTPRAREQTGFVARQRQRQRGLRSAVSCHDKPNRSDTRVDHLADRHRCLAVDLARLDRSTACAADVAAGACAHARRFGFGSIIIRVDAATSVGFKAAASARRKTWVTGAGNHPRSRGAEPDPHASGIVAERMAITRSRRSSRPSQRRSRGGTRRRRHRLWGRSDQDRAVRSAGIARAWRGRDP